MTIVDKAANHIDIDKLSSKEIRELSRKLVKRYVQLEHGQEQFIPGETTITHGGRVFDEADLISLQESCFDFWLTDGLRTDLFEKKLARFLNVRYCILTNSGSSANLLAMSALTSPALGSRRLRNGDEVITAAAAFPTTVFPIIQNNCIPVFVDVDISTYNVIPGEIEKAITDRTKAIFLAHTLGVPFDIESIKKICKKHQLWLIEDNCDALGSKYSKQYTGSIGDIGTISFYPPHHITMGEGGAVVTNNRILRRIINSYRGWGRDCWCPAGEDDVCGKRFSWNYKKLPKGYDHKFVFSHIGYNLKATDMQAAIGLTQLDKLPSFIESRRSNWQFFYERLIKFEDYFHFMKSPKEAEPSWMGFSLLVKPNAPFDRKTIVGYLEGKKIRTRTLFAGNLTKQPCFDEVEYRVVGNLDNTDYIMRNNFWYSVYPGLTTEMRKYIVSCIENFVNKYT